jgi:ribosomal protein L7/L12
MDSAVRHNLDALTQRVRVLEANVAVLAEAAGMTIASPTDAIPDEVKALVLDGKRLQAMAKYRELTGAGMEEARSAVASI